jgi:hypothetical protein
MRTPAPLFFEYHRVGGVTGMITTLPPLKLPSRAWLACVGASLALHVVVLATSGPQGSSGASPFDGSADLRIALVDAFTPSGESVVPMADPLPKLEAGGLAPTRGYPKLLKFSPVDLPPRKFDESLYRPLSVLTVPPSAASEISVSYPSDPRGGLLVAALTLFIDEDGSVAKVRAEAPHAPADYEKAAIAAFSHARFKPGMAGPSAVKTRMVIRVAFDSGVPEGVANSSAGIRFR